MTARARLERFAKRLEAALAFEDVPVPALATEDRVACAPSADRTLRGFSAKATVLDPPDRTDRTEEGAATAPPRAVQRWRESAQKPWLVAGAIASCAAILTVALIAEIGGARPSGSVPAVAAEPSPAPATRIRPPAAPVAPAARPAPPARPDAPASRTIVVARGDTLWRLSARHLRDPGRWSELYEANRDLVRDPDRIHPGEELKLPPR